MGFDEGDYVRLVLNPDVGKGTVHQGIDHKGRPAILFRHDPRFAEQLGEFFVAEYDIQLCEYPTDSEVDQINQLLRENKPQ